ncbi:hypothetical protein CDD82_3933 [Ophiocordyceps australis]|uniref:G-patch domain-containing protein n=1 Tax=Ophiocordyceps australis TaxID=1399860 RepID=A0A2C5ZUJ2_9HYPO|nr:hypothetical protein CDD82_3933 [Ophiocordyceps australis]
MDHFRSGYAFDPSRLNKATAADGSSSDSEDEDDHILPGIGDDDEFAGLNPRKRRRLGGNSKEKAALGIFGSDSDDDGPGKAWKRKNLRKKGVDFVTTAAPTVNSQDDEHDSEDDAPELSGQHIKLAQDESEDSQGGSQDDDDGIGMGFSTKKQGLAWQARAKIPKKDNNPARPPASTIKTTFDGTSVLGRGFVPSSEYMATLMADDGAASVPRNKPQPSAFGTKGKINATSFGARMMAKMGYVEGKGLGKEGQGRNIVIEANLRPQGVGLGAVKEKSEQERQEEKRQARLRGEEVIDSDEEQKNKQRKARNRALHSAPNSATATPRRHKTKYLTAEQFKASAPGLHIPDALAPILDMTGPEGKTLTSASAIMTPSSNLPESSELVEARKLVRRAHADLQAFSEEWQSLQERKKGLDQELRERQEQINDARSDFEGLETFVTLVAKELTPESDWFQVVGFLEKAVSLGAVNTETADLAVAAIHPFLKSSEWDPLAEPQRFASDLRPLSKLLTSWEGENKGQSVDGWNWKAGQTKGIYRRHRKTASPYESMMYKVWLPRMLAAVRDWDALKPDSMLKVVESWKDILPGFVQGQLMDSIERELESSLSEWDPRKKGQSHQLPHTWLFPWLQYMPGYHLDPNGTGLVAKVRSKFKKLIDMWQFEWGVVPGLMQWQGVMGEQWRSLIMSHVLPSMGKYLQANFRVEPADQEPYLAVLEGVLGWHELLGDAVMGEVVRENVLPRWLAKLQEWLAGEADVGEVADWYEWWRVVVLEKLVETEGVGRELDKGLQMMNLV